MTVQGGAKPAAIDAESGRVLNYAELATTSKRLANCLRANGFDRGDRVAILMENRVEWLAAMWGVRRAGMRFVPVNWHLHPDEVRYMLANSDARALIASDQLRRLAADASEGIEAITCKLAVGGSGDGFEDLAATLEGFSDIAPANERDGAAMPYSSGTTGQPKGILRALEDAPFATPSSLETLLSGLYAIDAETIYLSPAPLYHSSPVGFTNTVLVKGGTIVLMPSFDAEAALAAIERFSITHVQFVPTHFVRLLRLPEEVRRSYDLSSLKVVVHAAAPCAPEVKRAMIAWLGPIVHEYYAGSERCGFTAIDSADWLAHPGSVGRSRTGAIHILDLDTGEELPPGEIGAVYFEDPDPFEYHKDATKTAATFSRQGWGSHGDVGKVDGESYLYLADRRSDLILSGGVNIYPQEMENVLMLHPSVADCAVIGVANPEFGQEVRAVVQLLPDAPPADAAELIAHSRARIAGFKSPRSVVFVETLPRLPNGKLLRRRLTDLATLHAD